MNERFKPKCNKFEPFGALQPIVALATAQNKTASPVKACCFQFDLESDLLDHCIYCVLLYALDAV